MAELGCGRVSGFSGSLGVGIGWEACRGVYGASGGLSLGISINWRDSGWVGAGVARYGAVGRSVGLGSDLPVCLCSSPVSYVCLQ